MGSELGKDDDRDFLIGKIGVEIHKYGIPSTITSYC
jgi:hypothetical protein